MSCDYARMNENVQLVFHYSDYNCVRKYRMSIQKGSKLTLSTYTSIRIFKNAWNRRSARNIEIIFRFLPISVIVCGQHIFSKQKYLIYSTILFYGLS
jgi:hypothetical protein